MKFQSKPVLGFTTKVNGRADVLKNDIFLSEAYNPQSGSPAPEKKQFICIWDTGATATVIQKRVADALNLVPTGKVNIAGVGMDGRPNEFETNSYLVNLYLPNNATIIGVRVAEATVAEADVLIGMDIIGLGDFAITNCEGLTCWTFRLPSVEEIDFVVEINEHNRKYKHLLVSGDQRRMERNRAKRERRRNR